MTTRGCEEHFENREGLFKRKQTALLSKDRQVNLKKILLDFLRAHIQFEEGPKKMESGRGCFSVTTALSGIHEAWAPFSSPREGSGRTSCFPVSSSVCFIPVMLKVNKGETVHFLLDNYIIFYGVRLIML